MSRQEKPKEKKLNRNYLLHSVIAIAIMVFFRYIPPFGQMTSLGMELLGIFLGALWGWIKCDMIWPSVLAFIFLGFSDYISDASTAIANMFGNQLVQLIIWLFIFAAILTVSGISEQIAKRLIASKFTKGRPWVLSIIIFLACYVASALGAAFAVILICWEFIFMISKQVGYTKDDKWPRMMIVGVVFISTIGVVILPFMFSAVSTFSYLSAASGGLYGTYNYLNYLIFSLLFSFAIMAIYMLINIFIIRPPLEKLKEASIDTGDIPPFNTKQKIAVLALVALILVTVLPSILPEGIKAFMNTIGTPTLVLSICAIITIPRDKTGKPYYTFQELASKGMYWNTIFLVITALTMGTALANAETGFNATFIQWFMPVMSNTSPYIFTLLVCIATLILTNLINNIIAGAVMVPLMYAFANTIGANPVVITVFIVFCSGMGILLPSSSPFGALLIGNKDWVDTKDIFVYTMAGLAATILAIALIGIPLANVFFPLS